MLSWHCKRDQSSPLGHPRIDVPAPVAGKVTWTLPEEPHRARCLPRQVTTARAVLGRFECIFHKDLPKPDLRQLGDSPGGGC